MFRLFSRWFKSRKPDLVIYTDKASSEEITRQAYLDDLVYLAKSRIQHSLYDTKTLTTRIRLDMNKLGNNVEGVKPRIFALSPYIISIRFRTIRDNTYMIIQYRKDEDGEYIRRKPKH